jgi:ferrochelatase
MQLQKITGILLLNLGGPESQEDVEPFLYNLFSDRQIIRLGPLFLQKPIARLIARRRAPTSRENYRKIGGGSPIGRITANQARALEQKLSSQGSFLVRPCMRYWEPSTTRAVSEMVQAGVSRLVALPLYPHYSVATTGSSLSDLQRATRKTAPSLPVLEIRSWPDEPSYIACLAEKIRQGLAAFGGEPVEVVYSAHSLPKKFVDEGDPYVDEIKLTIGALEEITCVQGQLCFQSRSGPVEWLEPSTPDMLRELAGQGCRNILMVPISFVSDHVETLYEIDMLYRDMAAEMGMRLESTRGLNDDPLFIEALANLVLNRIRNTP